MLFWSCVHISVDNIGSARLTPRDAEWYLRTPFFFCVCDLLIFLHRLSSTSQADFGAASHPGVSDSTHRRRATFAVE